MAKKFRLVAGLWITPDFTDVLAGRAEAPRVNHDKVDFAALREALKETFHYGPQVEIVVPNDTIDQVSVHVRNERLVEASVRCEDFGNALLKAAGNASQPVVDVRSHWARLHALPDRSHAPPPVILPFVVQAEDFEDAMIWMASTRPQLGLKMIDPVHIATNPAEEVEHNGRLNAVLKRRVEEIFGTKYEAHALIDQMASDELTPAYGDIVKEGRRR